MREKNALVTVLLSFDTLLPQANTGLPKLQKATMTVKLLKDRKKRKAAELSWNTLTKLKNYYRPTTREEYVAVQKEIKLTINDQRWILKDVAKKELKALADNIYHDPDLQPLVTRATVDSPIIAELEQALCSREKDPKSKRPFLEVLERLEHTISQQINEIEFFFPVEGIALENIDKVGHGTVELFFCDQVACDQLFYEHLGRNSSQQSDIVQSRRDFFERDFLDRVLIKSVAYGDDATSQKKSISASTRVYKLFEVCTMLFHSRASYRTNYQSEPFC